MNQRIARLESIIGRTIAPIFRRAVTSWSTRNSSRTDYVRPVNNQSPKGHLGCATLAGSQSPVFADVARPCRHRGLEGGRKGGTRCWLWPPLGARSRCRLGLRRPRTLPCPTEAQGGPPMNRPSTETVQCDHEGIGLPGCRTCDPKTYGKPICQECAHAIIDTNGCMAVVGPAGARKFCQCVRCCA